MSTTRRLRRQAQRHAAITAAKASGCTCRPEIRHVRSIDGVPHLEVRHDDWCPMNDHGTQYVIHRQPGCDR